MNSWRNRGGKYLDSRLNPRKKVMEESRKEFLKEVGKKFLKMNGPRIIKIMGDISTVMILET